MNEFLGFAIAIVAGGIGYHIGFKDGKERFKEIVTSGDMNTIIERIKEMESGEEESRNKA